MLLFINYLSIMISTAYIYFKLLQLKSDTYKIIYIIGFIPILSLILTNLNPLTPYSTILIMLLSLTLFFSKLYSINSEINIVTIIISCGISYCIFYVCTFLISLITITFLGLNTYLNNRILVHTIIMMAHIIFSIIIFLPKRLRKGMPFIYNKLGYTTLLLTSLLILFIGLIINHTNADHLFITLYFTIFIFAISLYISWTNNLTRTYRDKLRDRDIDILTEHIEELEAEYKKLAEDKDELAKIVHRDNKLVPAMLLSVESFLTEFSDATPEMKSRGQELMAELNKEAERRKGILKQQDQKCTAKLISTGIPYLDSVLTYMQEKAMSKDIVLSASGDPGIADLAARTIEEEDLKTLAADMLENAIIANTHNHGSNIYFVIGYFGKHMAIYVYDSGIPFTKEVLLDLGIQKHTTHEADGGSGIGLMTIFELVRKYRATYIIDEYSTPTGPYTKRITIVFDKRRKYILNTSRPKEEIDFLRQRADLIIEARKEPHIK